MIAFAVERYAQCGLEIAASAENHVSELLPYEGGYEFDPNLQIYEKLDEIGALHIVTAREGEKLCGYAIFMLMRHMHYRILWAAGDGLWLSKSVRRPRVALRLIKVCEDSLRARGVVLLNIPAPPKDQKLVRLLVAGGYELSSSAYSRRL